MRSQQYNASGEKANSVLARLNRSLVCGGREREREREREKEWLHCALNKYLNLYDLLRTPHFMEPLTRRRVGTQLQE